MVAHREKHEPEPRPPHGAVMDSTQQGPVLGLKPVRYAFIAGSMIRGIIANPVYRGIVRVRNQHRDDAPGALGAEWEEFRGRHSALVSDDLWFRANRLLKPIDKSTQRTLRSRKTQSMGLLQGLLVCACCEGSAMSPSASTRLQKGGVRHMYYRCTRLIKGAKQSNCSTKQVSGSAIESAVIALIQSVEANSAILIRVGFDSPSRKREEMISKCKAEVLRLDDLMQQNRLGISNLVGFIQKGEVTALAADAHSKAEELKAAIANLEHQRIQFEAQLHKLSGRIPQISELGKAFGPIAKALQFANHAQKYEIIHRIIKSINVRRVVVAGESVSRSRSKARTFRIAIECKTDAIMKFSESDLKGVYATTGFSNIVLNVTFEVVSNSLEQRVTLLESGYSFVSASYEPPDATTAATVGLSEENPVQSAIRWKALMADGETTAVLISKRENVSRTLISQNLALLRLPQLIVDFLKDGRDRDLKPPIARRELLRLLDLPSRDAISSFHARVAGQPLQDVMQLKDRTTDFKDLP